MPYLSIQTNGVIADADKASLLKTASSLVAKSLGKPERYVMVAIEPQTPMTFGGSDAPCAYLELKSIGLSSSQTAGLSSELAALMNATAGISQDRVYIEFSDASGAFWGWNGATF